MASSLEIVDPFAGFQVVATVFYGGRVYEVFGPKDGLTNAEFLNFAEAIKGTLAKGEPLIVSEGMRFREVGAARSEMKVERSQAELVRTVSAFNQGIIDLPTYNRMMYGEGMPGHPEIGRSPLKQSAYDDLPAPVTVRSEE